jgi:hypothetical protein
MGRLAKRTSFLMLTGPGIVEVRYTSRANGERSSALADPRFGERKPEPMIMSERSRRNMQKAALRFPWDELGRMALLSMTYPAEFPQDGREVKRHIRLFWARWARHFGARPRGMWCFEFQRRGAPHVHFFCGIPPEADEEAFRWWAFRTWSEVAEFPVGQEVPHFQAGLRLNVAWAWYATGRPPVVVASYLWRHAGKWRQKAVPPGFVNVGHFWGAVGGPPKQEEELCCERSYFQVRRAIRTMGEKRARREWGRPLRQGRYAYLGGHSRGGVWSKVGNGETVGHRLKEWAEAECMAEGRHTEGVAAHGQAGLPASA